MNLWNRRVVQTHNTSGSKSCFPIHLPICLTPLFTFESLLDQKRLNGIPEPYSTISPRHPHRSQQHFNLSISEFKEFRGSRLRSDCKSMMATLSQTKSATCYVIFQKQATFLGTRVPLSWRDLKHVNFGVYATIHNNNIRK